MGVPVLGIRREAVDRLPGCGAVAAGRLVELTLEVEADHRMAVGQQHRDGDGAGFAAAGWGSQDDVPGTAKVKVVAAIAADEDAFRTTLQQAGACDVATGGKAGIAVERASPRPEQGDSNGQPRRQRQSEAGPAGKVDGRGIGPDGFQVQRPEITEVSAELDRISQPKQPQGKAPTQPQPR